MSTPETEESTAPSASRRRRPWKRWLMWGALASLVLFGLIQLVPFGHGKNPPVTKAAVWPSAQAQTLAENGCYDCHSNLTKRWWATEVAPASWLAQSDVNGGRNALNFSEWDKPQARWTRWSSRCSRDPCHRCSTSSSTATRAWSDAERRQLVDGLRQLYATDPPAGTKQGGG